MKTFKIIGMNTGFLKGTIKGTDLQDAENKASEKGIDLYDEYMLVSDDAELHPASSYIEDVLNR